MQKLTRKQSLWGQHGAHLGPVGPRWAPCWPHEPSYQGYDVIHCCFHRRYVTLYFTCIHDVVNATCGEEAAHWQLEFDQRIHGPSLAFIGCPLIQDFYSLWPRKWHFYYNLTIYITLLFCLFNFFRDVWGMDKGGVRINKGCDLVHWVLGPHLLTPINFNANMDMELQPLSSVGWNYLSIPKLDATVQVLEWINNFIPHLPGHVITYPCWD